MSLCAAEMKDMTTQQVVLILGLSTLLSTVIIWLAIIGADPVQVVLGIAPVLVFVGGAFGWAKVNALQRDVGEVKELSNGRITAAQEEIKRLNTTLHAMSLLVQPPPPDQETK